MSVGPTRGPVQRPDLDRDLSEIFGRLQDLERALSAAGIQCSFLNVCEWFSLETTGEQPSTDTGFALIIGAGKDLDITMVGGGNFEVLGGTSSISKSTSSATLTSSGGTVKAETAGITVRVFSGKVFTLLDSAGNPILQMTDGSPDLHLPAGGNVIFDL